MTSGTIFSLATGAAIVFLVFFLLYPVAVILSGSLPATAPRPTFFFELLLQQRQFYLDLFTTINLALLVTVLSSLIGLFLGIVLHRYEFFGRRAAQILVLTPLILPPFVGAIGLRRMLSLFGPINIALMDLGVIEAPIDWLGSAKFFGVAAVQSLHLYPIVLINIAAALKGIDHSLAEAAVSVGARPWTVFRKITLPLLSPSLFAGASIVFIWSFTDLGTPLVFDYRELLAVRLFRLSDEFHTNPTGYALVLIILLVTATLFLAAKAGFAQQNLALSKVGYLAPPRKAVRGWNAVAILLPLGGIIALSFLPHLGVILTSLAEQWFMTALPARYSFESYAELVHHPLTSHSVKNSVVLSLASTSLDIVLGLLFAFAISRAGRRIAVISEILTVLPLAIPGLVLAFGYLGTFAGTALDPRENPVPLLIIGYAVRRLPFIVRSLVAGLATANRTLEEAAHSVGASPARTFRSITFPLLLPHLIAGGILCFCFAMLEVSESLLLAMEERYYPITKAMYALLSRPDGIVIASALGVGCTVFVALCMMTASRLTSRHGGSR